MILARQIFHIKFGQMDAALALIREAADSGVGTNFTSRVLTDISGPMFTLIFESEAESVDAYMARLETAFADPGAADFNGRMLQLVESGRKEFYTIEMTA